MTHTRIALRQSMTVRLTAVLLIPMALCLVGYGYSNVRLRRAEMLAEAEHEVRDHGTALEVALDAFLRDRNLDDMAEMTEDLSRAERILGVLIFDPQQRLVQSSAAVTSLRPRVQSLAAQALRDRRPHGQTLPFGTSSLYAFAFPIGVDEGQSPRGSAVLIRDLAYIDRNLDDSAHHIARIGLLLALVVVLGTLWGLHTTVLRPVDSVVRSVERVTAGSIDEKVIVTRPDEIGRLASAFNAMLTSLREADRALRERDEANQALERRLRHAQRLALIGQLAANVAHQIGSPLNVVLGRARYALQLGIEDPKLLRHTEAIHAGAEAISKVIEQLLSQVRRARGHNERVELASVARETLRFLEAECERLQITATLDADESLHVVGHRDEIEQVLLNLCVNAIQAQPRGGLLTVTVRAVEMHGQPAVEMLVEDAGPGIPEALREQIFEAFFTTKAPTEGTGLGLSICEEIVHRHGGTIRAESLPKRGARMRVLIPTAPIEEAS